MNNRLKEMMLEAGYAAPEIAGRANKLAELIIRECARVATATPCPYTDEPMIQQLGHTWDMACVESGRAVKKHFGV